MNALNGFNDLNELVERYATYLRALNRARKTIQAHVKYIKRFFDFTATHGVDHPGDVAQPLLLDYQQHVAQAISANGTAYSVSTQNHHLTCLACFFRYLKQAGFIAHNPTLELQYAKVPQRLPRAVLTHKDMKKLLRQPDTSTVLSFRDRTIMELLYSTGIRRKEVLGLDVEDIDLDSGFLMVREGKGKKDRVVPLGKVACRYIETYLNGIRPEFLKRCPDPKTPALFPSTRSDRLRRNALNEMIRKYGRRADLRHVSPHTFRHSCATALIRNRADIRHVQEMLGHAKLTTTQDYILLTRTDLKEAHSRFHPREKDK